MQVNVQTKSHDRTNIRGQRGINSSRGGLLSQDALVYFMEAISGLLLLLSPLFISMRLQQNEGTGVFLPPSVHNLHISLLEVHL